ncbi:oligoendopeptidase F [Thermanaerovibrio velox DSM 12556]|uniref:Oligopeptidase F n=1 Tax=Thermanaerovibrio velox DSM 12556 TaxID=926567 RepID=H0UN06_9BACT|nr:oligoendopeptidase F [Thermanaerovibrio velox]EHM09285.1 oligoendopeptidase F [Thermanaerovibrio velox DSM 12556]
MNPRTVVITAALLATLSSSAGAGSLPDRKDVPVELKWRLEDIYPNERAFEGDLKALKGRMGEVERFKGRLSSSPEVLAECLKLKDQLAITMGKLYAYGVMRSHEDTSDPKRQALADRVSSLSTELETLCSFIVPEITQMDPKRLSEFMEHPSLKDHRFFLSEIARKRAHVLSPREEELLAMAGDALETPDQAFSMLTNADMTFSPITDEKGNLTEMSEERYYRFVRSKDRRVRKEAYDSLYDAYGRFTNTLGATFGGMLKGSLFLAKARKYPSVLAMALDDDAIPEEVYHNLVRTVESRLEPLHRYVKFRAKALKLQRIEPYDLHVPLADEPKTDIPWQEAKALVLEALKPLGDEYVRIAREGMEKGWIDVMENKGKRGGAYSWGSYGTHPYILMNYNGTLNDVFTLAHEMGHSMHTYYSNLNQPYPTSDYSIFVAEVASTFNEMLLLDHLIKNAKDPNEKRYLINYQLDQIRSTLYRQTMFASFEREVHRRHAEGEPVTPKELKELWEKLNGDYHGEAFHVDSKLLMEWARIPHFYSPFYVFQYATGISAAISLSSAVLSGDPSARDRYLEMLKKGGSKHPIELLKEAGVDMSSPKPIEDAIRLFDRRLKELEEMDAR